MPAATLDLTITCARDFYLEITNQTGLQNPFNLTGYVTYLTVKKAINDADAAAIYSGAPWSSNLTFGKITFKIPHTTTAGWWLSTGPISTTVVYGVAYADTANPKNWTTVLSGSVTLVQPVLIAIPGG